MCTWILATTVYLWCGVMCKEMPYVLLMIPVKNVKTAFLSIKPFCCVTSLMLSGCIISKVGSVRSGLDSATDSCWHRARESDATPANGLFRDLSVFEASVQTWSCRSERVFFSGRETCDVCSFMEWCESVWSWKEDRHHKGGAAAGHLVAITQGLKSRDPPAHTHVSLSHNIGSAFVYSSPSSILFIWFILNNCTCL